MESSLNQDDQSIERCSFCDRPVVGQWFPFDVRVEGYNEGVGYLHLCDDHWEQFSDRVLYTEELGEPITNYTCVFCGEPAHTSRFIPTIRFGESPVAYSVAEVNWKEAFYLCANHTHLFRDREFWFQSDIR